jgi:hypothetical protein
MKYLLFTLLSTCCAIAQITDDFSDGNFTQNPIWFGNDSHFEIDSLNQLHLNAPSQTANSFLCFKSSLLENTLWEVSLKMDFNPSSSNYLDWYILASDSVLDLSNEAYFLRIGGTDDQIILYKKQGEEITALISSSEGIINTNMVEIRLKVERKIGGVFDVWADFENDTIWSLIGNAIDLTELNALYSGINCKYTSTRSDKFYFDDFSINGLTFIDSISPKLIKAELINNSNILLEFSKNEPLVLSNQQFEILPESINPMTVLQNENLVHLSFENSFPINEEFQLKIASISDSSANYMNDTLIDLYLQQHQQFDLIINEIMVDPEPLVQLDNIEYIELYNRAPYTINLIDWLLVIDYKEYKIDTLSIEANEYLIVHNEDDSLFFEDYNSTSISFSSLNKTEGYIGLFDQEKQLIHEVYYSKDWYKNANKENGGWSLEMMDYNNYCTGTENWIACENLLGGTPGLPNSVLQENPDTSNPFIENIVILKENEIQLYWSENLYDSTLYFFNSYEFTNELMPQEVHHFMNHTNVLFFDDLYTNTKYQINIGELNDCQGNHNTITGDFVLGIWAEEDQIILNEILFNPKTDGYDYIELYNKSENYLDLSKLLIGNYDSQLESIVNTEIISEAIYTIPPKSYVVLCKDTTWLNINYIRTEQSIYIEMPQMPSLPNSQGTLAISDIAYQLIDSISYTEEQHFPLLEDLDGVALERLNPESEQWFSAAATDNYGTPGRENSQFIYQKNSNSTLSVDPEIFSPNNDGEKDFTSIVLQLEESAKTSISIYNKQGFLVKKVCTNELVNAKSEWIWNGLNEDSFRLPIGIYILVAEMIDSDRKVEILKEPIVISGY